ncbi:MAG: hypothetical protein US86_C0019G0002 [Candidatus Daviesbacteria bacterium GW2011_GWA2_38_24]|uniref:Uncharacterized protein n=1 Tax=Candidatus Daviesbacteria bacterium GW2011_GWA2_38_24 TaxID=1618422 RepID=A0A0G0LT08_9BACT|nr:MAG: hypothetical protein US86_C0019G0002 [Candidatus Daviesbacteria bacterium GW2011_GWA2_38_24]
MSNFSPKLEKATDEQLKHWVNEGNFQIVPLASDELTRRTLSELQKTIQVFNEQASKQTEKMIEVTNLIAMLTTLMLVGLIVQIYLAKIQVSPILYEKQRNERQAYENCKEYPEGDWPSATGVKVSCRNVLEMLNGKFESKI